MKLKDVVDDYLRNNRLDWQLSDFRCQRYNLDETIRKAVYTETPKLTQRHKSYAKGNRARKQAVARLQQSKGTLGTPTKYEDVLDWVLQVTQGVPEFIDLGPYDTSLGLTLYFQCALPTNVHIHCGAEEGAIAVFGRKQFKNLVRPYPKYHHLKIITPMAFPDDITKRLQPYQIENFLCEKKRDLKNLRD